MICIYNAICGVAKCPRADYSNANQVLSSDVLNPRSLPPLATFFNDRPLDVPENFSDNTPSLMAPRYDSIYSQIERY